MHKTRDYRFAAGLLAGTVVGAGLAMWLAPRAAGEARQRLTNAARNLSRQASAQYQDAGAKIVEAVDEITRKGHELRNGVADAVARGADEVARGAEEVARYATGSPSRHSGRTVST